MSRPFQQLRFRDLPDRPRRAHPFAELEVRHVDVPSRDFGDVRVAYREVGEGPPLLLVHGLMTTGYSFRYLVEPLAHRRLVIPDLVGCGRSDKPDRAYPLEAVARFIADLQRALDLWGVDVVGNSMGGYLSMILALDEPTSTRRLVNIHSPGLPLARLHALHAAMSLPGSEALLHRLIGLDPLRWAHGNVHYWDETLKSLEEAREYGEPLRDPAGSRAFARYLRDTIAPAPMARFAARLRSGRFPVPLCLIYAERDPIVPPSVGRGLSAAIPEAEMIWLAECSHFAQVDQPERLAEQIDRFFS
ncbi:MAG: alpha/beta hydrolase [Polyangiaceae bacterium]